MADRYWVGGAGDWFSTSSWSTSSGGFSGASVPTASDNVFFDDSSRGIPAQQGFGVSFSSNAVYCNNLSIALTSGKNLNWNSNNANLFMYISGDIFIATEGTYFPTVLVNNTLKADVVFVGTGLSTVNLNTATIRGLQISKTGAGYVALLNHIEVSASTAANYGLNEFRLSSGNITLNGYTVTADFFEGSGSAARSINFSNGAIELTYPSSTPISYIVNLTNSTNLSTDDLGYIRLNGGISRNVFLSKTALESEALSFEVVSNITYTFSFGGSTLVADTPVVSSIKLTSGIVITPDPTTSGACPPLLSYGNIITGAGFIRCGITLASSTKNQLIDATAGPLNGAANTWSRYPVLTINKPTRTFSLFVDTTCTNFAMVLTQGTLDMAGYTLAVRSFDSSNSNVRSLTFNGGTLRIQNGWVASGSSDTIFTLNTDTNLTTDADTGVLRIDASRGSVYVGGYDTGKKINYFFAVLSSSITFYTSGGILAFRNITSPANVIIRNSPTSTPIEFWGNITVASQLNLGATRSVTSFKGSGTIEATAFNSSIPVIAHYDDVYFNGGTWTFLSNISFTSSIGDDVYFTDGTIDTNGYTVTFNNSFISTVTTGTRNLILGNSIIEFSYFGTVLDFNTTNMGTISFGSNAEFQFEGTSSKALRIQGPARSFPKIRQSGAPVTINADNMTFDGISNSAGANNVIFQSGTTTLFNSFSLSGTSTSTRQFISSTTVGSPAYIEVTTKDVDVNVSFCNIRDSYANNTDTNWNAFAVNGNIDGGNNRGWRFSEIEGGAFMAFF